MVLSYSPGSTKYQSKPIFKNMQYIQQFTLRHMHTPHEVETLSQPASQHSRNVKNAHASKSIKKHRREK